MEKILPEVGSSGVFKVLSPFDGFILEQVQYTCTSIRSISELQTYTRNVLEEYYLVYGLTVEDYQRDISENELIISLRNGADFVYIPSKYLISYPDVSGVPYHVVSLAVTLGAIPIGSDLSVLKEKISELVTNNTGLTPDIEEVEISATKYIEQNEHEAVVTRRNYLTTDNDTYYLKYQKKLTEYEQTLLKVNDLETFISSTYGIGNVTSRCDAVNQLKVSRDRNTNSVILETQNDVKVVINNNGDVIYYFNDEEVYRYHDSLLNVNLGQHSFDLINRELVNDYIRIYSEGNRFYINSSNIQTVTDITGTGEIHNSFMDVSVVNSNLNVSLGEFNINANRQEVNLTNSNYRARFDNDTARIDTSENRYVIVENGVIKVYSDGILVYSAEQPTEAPTEAPTTAPTEPPTVAPVNTNLEIEDIYYNKCCFVDVSSAEGMYITRDSLLSGTYLLQLDTIQAPTEPPTVAPVNTNLEIEDIYYNKCCFVDVSSAEGMYITRDSLLSGTYLLQLDTIQAPTEPPTVAPVNTNLEIEDIYYNKCCFVDVSSAEGMYITRDSLLSGTYLLQLDTIQAPTEPPTVAPTEPPTVPIPAPVLEEYYFNCCTVEITDPISWYITKDNIKY